MECPSCHFQNIPGTQECVRCRTLLNLEAVDFLPPRAASGRMQRQAQAAVQRAQFRFTEGWMDVGRALRLPELHGLGMQHVLLALVPGLPQIRARSAGMRFVGWCVLSLWMVMLLTALLTIGSGFSILLSFALVSVHCFSISLMMTPALQTTPLPLRVVVGICMYFLVMFCLYWPVAAGFRNVSHVLAIQGLASRGAIGNGDVLVYSGPWTRPRQWSRGDIVVVGVQPVGGHNYVLAGVNVDRVVAVAGDLVEIKAGQLLVNNEEPPPDQRPLGSVRQYPNMLIEVPHGSVLVFPSLLSVRLAGNWSEFLYSVSVVRDEDVMGRVMFRLRPWTQFGILQGAQE